MSGDKCWVPIADGVATCDGYSGATTLGNVGVAALTVHRGVIHYFLGEPSIRIVLWELFPDLLAETSVIAILLGAAYLNCYRRRQLENNAKYCYRCFVYGRYT